MKCSNCGQELDPNVGHGLIKDQYMCLICVFGGDREKEKTNEPSGDKEEIPKPRDP